MPEEGFREAVAHGINKVNICTSMIQAASEQMVGAVDNRGDARIGFPQLCGIAQSAIKDVVKEHMNIFGTQSLTVKRNPMIFGEKAPK